MHTGKLLKSCHERAWAPQAGPGKLILSNAPHAAAFKVFSLKHVRLVKSLPTVLLFGQVCFYLPGHLSFERQKCSRKESKSTKPKRRCAVCFYAAENLLSRSTQPSDGESPAPSRPSPPRPAQRRPRAQLPHTRLCAHASLPPPAGRGGDSRRRAGPPAAPLWAVAARGGASASFLLPASCFLLPASCFLLPLGSAARRGVAVPRGGGRPGQEAPAGGKREAARSPPPAMPSRCRRPLAGQSSPRRAARCRAAPGASPSRAVSSLRRDLVLLVRRLPRPRRRPTSGAGEMWPWGGGGSVRARPAVTAASG